MATFTFRLQPLLDQKSELEKKAHLAVVEKKSELQQKQSALDRLIENEKQLECLILRTRHDLFSSALNAGVAVQRKNDYLQALGHDLKTAHSEMLVQKFAVEDAELELAAAQTRLFECAQETAKLSKYREKLERRFRSAAAKEEERAHDELGTILFSRRAGA